MNRKGFTLLELIVVLIVMAALVAIALPQYAGFVERGRAAEAITSIGAIKAAEEATRLQDVTAPSLYVACANTAAVNTNLGVDLVGANWTYSVTVNAVEPAIMTITADRAGAADTVDTVIMTYNSGTGVTTWGGDHPGAPR